MNYLASPQPLGVFPRHSSRRRNIRPRQDSNQIFAGIASTLRSDAGFRQHALSLILSGDDKANLLIQALGSSSSQESQEALNRLVREAPPGDPFRSRLLRSLSDCLEPLPETLETHLALLDDPEVGSQALIGLGKLIQTMVRHHDWPQAQRGLEELLSRLHAAADDGKRIRCLRALAHAGHPAAADFIQPFLNHRSAETRKEAVGSLQWIPGEAIDRRLVCRALADGCPGVRLKAITVLGQRSPSNVVVAGLKRVLATDPSSEVQRQAALVLAALSPPGGCGPREAGARRPRPFIDS